MRNAAPIAAAFIVDLIISLVVASSLVLLLLGQRTPDGGIGVSGGVSVVPFVLVLIYFFVMDRWFGGTIGKRMLGIAR